MAGTKLLKWLVDYHTNVNLDRCIPHIREGRVHQNGQPIKEGTENIYTRGCLIIQNGDKIVETLRKYGILLSEPEGHVEIDSSEGFSEFFSATEDLDGAYIFDSKNGVMSRVSELSNNPVLPEDYDMLKMLPFDFVHYNGTELPPNKIGTKTRLALKIPIACPGTETYQIKRSGYTELGMGPVTHMDQEGLAEEFFFLYSPNSPGHFVRPEHGIAGVYRQFAIDPESKRPFPILERRAGPCEAEYASSSGHLASKY